MIDQSAIALIKSAWTLPFIYDDYNGQILDAENRLVFQVRSWGYLLDHMSPKKATETQDAIGKLTVELLNSSIE